MDGRNSAGRRISLLNESEGPIYTAHHTSDSSRSASSVKLPSLSYPPSYHSRSSSYASTPVLSPQTPPLSRSDSSDSSDSRIMQIPSLITPDFSFEAAPFSSSQLSLSPEFAQKQAFFPPLPKDTQSTAYAPLPTQMAPFAYPVPPPAAAPAQQQQPFVAAAVPVPVPVPTPASPAKPAEQKPASSSKPQSKKNQYPCPMAKQFNCPDYFTTSGHAARHAKKHTGRKDAICPECNKAFTRKDNMEQHRRTHQNGRNTKATGDDGAQSARKAVKASQPSKRPKPSPLQPNSVAPVAVDAPLIDPMLPTSPGSSLVFSDAASLSQPAGALQPLTAFTSPYIDPEPYRYDALPGSFTAGLDTLAIVATDAERKRKYGGET